MLFFLKRFFVFIIYSSSTSEQATLNQVLVQTSIVLNVEEKNPGNFYSCTVQMPGSSGALFVLALRLTINIYYLLGFQL